MVVSSGEAHGEILTAIGTRLPIDLTKLVLRMRCITITKAFRRVAKTC